ncbi:MAG: helix-turn-helix transcriptional regulator [Bacillota bacterium]
MTAGSLLDRMRTIEYLAFAGLALLGVTFLFLPVAAQFGILPPMQILLEASYALIDLFIWCCIAIAAIFFRGQVLRYFSIGLFFNLLVFLSGEGINYYWQQLPGSYSYFYLALIAAALLFLGIIPALMLHRLQLSWSGTRVSEKQETAGFTPLIRMETQIRDLTARELEILKLIMEGLDNRAIGRRLKITRNTLKTHISHLYRKMGAKSRVELILKVTAWPSNLPGQHLTPLSSK